MDKVLDYWYNSGVAKGKSQQAEKTAEEKRRADAAEQELRQLKARLARYEPVD